MSADPNHYGTVSGPPAITEDPRPGFVPISDYLSLPLIEINDPWLLNSFSPPMSWAVGPAALTDSTASLEASFIAPYHLRDHQRARLRSSKQDQGMTFGATSGFTGGGIGRGARRHGEIADLDRPQKGRPWCLYMFA
ncbi:hypothetical protein ASPFODRAFT_38362 [Aspergillus luchuensis CBS 106.47]|uniref:Uncharacterized protein n=1 Tax=Aspergillus luchuensis (strain CBS 106.47) TaxID=1137211 RepID=A0A1M3T0L0_ASPLC|nr:hypothetical protein ASPFODRAFT_38362 [Aspergillus luchuensis CBS 106.47]